MQKKFKHKYINGKNCYHKVKDHCHYTCKYRDAAHSIFDLKYSTPKEIPVIFHNGLNYDYHFVIKELGKEFEEEFNCLREHTKKYKTFSVPTTKEAKRIEKFGKRNYKNHILQITIYL